MMIVIPAIDVMDGKCVRLRQGNYSQCKIYADDPVEVARAFEAAGTTRLHLVDLDGAKATGAVNMKVLSDICTKTRLSVDFGGGIKSREDIRRVFEAGADYACIGSIAQTDPQETLSWLETYGGEKLIVGADVWNTKICIQGWKKVTDTTLWQLIERYRGKIRYLLCTDIARDGLLQGPASDLYREILLRYPDLHLIASGGVAHEGDLQHLADIGVESVVVGKAFYEKKIGLEKIARWIC